MSRWWSLRNTWHEAPGGYSRVVWFLEDDPRQSLGARNGIESAENEKQLRLATGCVMDIKLTLGNLRLPLPF